MNASEMAEFDQSVDSRRLVFTYDTQLCSYHIV